MLRLESNSNDDGKRFTVLATAEARTCASRSTARIAWFGRTFGLRLTGACPPPISEMRRSGLLDGDTGRDMAARLQYVGPAQINVAGQVQNMAHWRLTGGVQVELWYDGRNGWSARNGWKTAIAPSWNWHAFAAKSVRKELWGKSSNLPKTSKPG